MLPINSLFSFAAGSFPIPFLLFYVTKHRRLEILWISLHAEVLCLICLTSWKPINVPPKMFILDSLRQIFLHLWPLMHLSYTEFIQWFAKLFIPSQCFLILLHYQHKLQCELRLIVIITMKPVIVNGKEMEHFFNVFFCVCGIHLDSRGSIFMLLNEI